MWSAELLCDVLERASGGDRGQQAVRAFQAAAAAGIAAAESDRAGWSTNTAVNVARVGRR